MCPPKRPSVVRFFYINGAASRSIAVRQSRSLPSRPSQPQASSSKDPLLFFLEHHHPMPTDEFLSGFPQPEPLIQEDPVDIFEHNWVPEHDWVPMSVDDFLAAMRRKKPSPEEAAFETAAGFQAPNTSHSHAQQVEDGQDTLYPGHANIPCLGVRTNSDKTDRAKKILLEQYESRGLELRCHTCGKNLRGGKIAYGFFLENIWVGDHQPPTSAHFRPAKMQEIMSFTQKMNIQVVESPDGKFQTRYPVPAQLTSLFLGQRPHPYPFYPPGKFLPQRYIYPQCESCSTLQSNNL